MNYKDFFKNKKIAVVGLGAHGEMVSDIKFMLVHKADVSLYDIRSEKRVKGFLPKLREAGLEKYSFGKIAEEELLSAELIILSSEISKKSHFLKKAIFSEIPIEFAETLFFKLAPPITLIGVMGMYGKTTVSNLIYKMLRKRFADYEEQGLFFIDPDSMGGILTHIKKIKKDDVVVMRIPIEFMKHYEEIHISPHVAVLTSSINYRILELQTYNNFIVAPDAVIDEIKKTTSLGSKAKMLRTRGNMIPTEWGISTKVPYNIENAALAMQVSEIFKVSRETSREIIQGFTGLKGHIELVKKSQGIEFYNDAFSATPIATLFALKLLATGKNIILIMGGAYTGYDHKDLIENIANYVSAIILLPGSGSVGIRNAIENLPETQFNQVLDLEEAVVEAKSIAKKGDIVLYSPAFDAVGVDTSRKERGEKFVKILRGL